MSDVERDQGRADDAVRERLRELYPSCETDCTDGCKYGCLGWLHRFDSRSSVAETDISREVTKEPGAGSAG